MGGRDPLVVHAARLREPASTTSDRALEARSRPSSTRPSTRPGALPARPPASLHDFVVRPRPARAEPPPPADDAPVFRTMDAVRTALEAELETDERVFVAGIDVGAGGNVFGLTRGLHERFGDRVRDTPISETAVMGLGVGAAMAGHAAGRRADVPRLRRRVPRPAAEPGGQAAVHDRRRGRRWR